MDTIDVLCAGHACYDLIFTVDHHPGPDEKARASAMISCGGGTAANAAMTVARLGYRAAFAGYLGTDIYGEEHLAELAAAGVDTTLVVRDAQPTPVSAILVKPNGHRTIVNYKGDTNHLDAGGLDLARVRPRVMLFDGHQPELALALARHAQQHGIPVVLDADTLNEGNRLLVHESDYIVASERFACEYSGAATPADGMVHLAKLARTVVVTLGEEGLIWQQGTESGALSAFQVPVVDTTGAGDTFHGAFAAGVAAGLEWTTLLRFASAAGALCCTVAGARLGIPTMAQVEALMAGRSAG